MTDTDPAGPADPDAGTARPPDVDTGFWLWAVALPLMVTGYVVHAVTAPDGTAALRYASAALVSVVVSALVVTFLVLMRSGYRWARTVLTGGGAASLVYAASNLFTVDRGPAASFAYAATTIIGSVLIVGGGYLLHRKDAQLWFTR